MEDKVIHVDFVSKTIISKPIEITPSKSPTASILEKIKKIFSFSNKSSNSSTEVYNYKHTM